MPLSPWPASLSLAGLPARCSYARTQGKAPGPKITLDTESREKPRRQAPQSGNEPVPKGNLQGVSWVTAGGKGPHSTRQTPKTDTGGRGDRRWYQYLRATRYGKGRADQVSGQHLAGGGEGGWFLRRTMKISVLGGACTSNLCSGTGSRAAEQSPLKHFPVLHCPHVIKPSGFRKQSWFSNPLNLAGKSCLHPGLSRRGLGVPKLLP